MIRVVLADDHALVRAGLRALLEATGTIEVVDEVGDGEAAVTAVARHRPDVLLLDVRMPRLDGIAVVRRVRQLGLAVPAILLTTFDDDAAMVAGIRAGARAFLLKDVEVGPLLEAIGRVAEGGDCLSGLPAERLVRAVRARAADATQPGWSNEPLTPREVQVLGLMCAGMSNPQIAESLALARGTVKNHVSVILAKLCTEDRTKAVLRALKDGLL